MYGEDCFQLRTCEWWCKEFKDGRQSVELLPHTGQLGSVCTATIATNSRYFEKEPEIIDADLTDDDEDEDNV